MLQLHAAANSIRDGNPATALLMITTLDSVPKAVMVHSSCGMDEQLYQEHLQRPGLFNLQLKVSIDSSTDPQIASISCLILLSLPAIIHGNS